MLYGMLIIITQRISIKGKLEVNFLYFIGDHSLWNLINEEILPDSLKYYVMFFVGDPMKMDMITKTLEPIPLCDRLFQSEYECVVKKVRELMICKCMLFASIIGYPYFAGIV